MNPRPSTSLLLLATALAGCTTPPEPDPPPAVATVSVTAPTPTLEVGDTVRLQAEARSAAGTPVIGPTTSWRSDDPTIASVSATGLVTAVAIGGPVSIVATVAQVSGSVAVSVVPVAVATVVVTPADTALYPGQTVPLLAEVRGARGQSITGRSVTWASSDAALVSVDQAGLATAVAIGGPVLLTATAEGKADTALIAVHDVPVAAVVIRSPVPELNEEGSTQLGVTLRDASGTVLTGRSVTWTSESPSLATVDSTGLVRALRAGTARIRAAAGQNAAATLELPIRGLIHRWTFAETGGPGVTFGDDIGGLAARLVGVGSAAGAAAGGRVMLTGGPKSRADYIALPSGLLSRASSATIEIWATLESHRFWSRVFDFGSGPGNSLFVAWSHGTDPNTDRTAFALGGAESRVDNALAPFSLGIQHHIVVSVADSAGTNGTTRVAVHLDGVLRGSFNTPHRLPQLLDRDLWLGRSHHPDETANASYDEVRIHDRVYPIAEVAAMYQRGPVRSTPVVAVELVRPPGMRDTVRGSPVTFPLRAVARDAGGARYPVRATWTSSNAAVATVDALGTVRVTGTGPVTFSAEVEGRVASTRLEVVRSVRVPIDPYLATPIANARWEVPVAVIAFLPTADGASIDVRKSPDFWFLGPLTLDSVEQRVLDYSRRRKMMVEEGSRFHGYRDPAARPSLGYRVVDYQIIYDLPPPSERFRWPGGPGSPRFPDYFRIFAEYGLSALVNQRGVREIWLAESSFDKSFPSYDPAIHDTLDSRAGFESNMSSPTTGDISNSFRWNDDLPVLDHTYILYGVSYRRSQAEAVHNVGHQLEAMFSHAAFVQDGNSRLFWRQFVGFNATDMFIPGRAGWTHMPPNTAGNYDYLNRTLVNADIEDWRPAGGPTRPVNVDTWGGLTYPWPGGPQFHQREESQWYTYWMQNMPGLGNRIPFGTRWMTNWWALVADWDAAMASGLGLHGHAPAASVGPGALGPADPPALRAAEPGRRWPVPEPSRAAGSRTRGVRQAPRRLPSVRHLAKLRPQSVGRAEARLADPPKSELT